MREAVSGFKVLVLALALGTAGSATLRADVEYVLLPLGTVPDGYINSGTGFNDRGQVVGWSQFYGADPGSKAWIWTPASGYALLPPAPGMPSYRAIDINDDGVIAGDGGYDSGESWRYAEGSYELLGTIGGDPISWTAGINEHGHVAGTSRGLQIAVPHKAFVDTTGGAMSEVQSSADAAYLNDVGQVVGWSQSATAFRYTPGVGVEFLPELATHPLSWASGVNNHGDVVGEAAHANGNAHIPFLYTDAGGTEPIGSFGGGAGAASINDARQVVGNLSSGGNHPWIWTETDGVRFLADLVDAPEYGLLSASRINQAGQILVRVTHLPTFAQQPALLLPLLPQGETDVGFMADGRTLQWDAVPGAASYAVYRGLLDDLGNLAGFGVCMNATDPETSDTTFEDPELPAPGAGYFYLVAWNDPAGRSFGMGTTSAGAPRTPAAPCP